MNLRQQKNGTLETLGMYAATKSVVALMAAVVPLVAGCTAEVNGALVIAGNQTPEVKESSCLVPSKTGDTPQQISGTGQYDVGLNKPYPYYFYPLIRNDMPITGNETMIEVNRIEYTGVEVKIEPPPGVTLPSSATCPNEFYFPERQSLLPGAAVGSAVQIFLPCHATAFAQMFASGALPKDTNVDVMFTAVVRAVGRLGGDKVRSDPFEWRVRVCLGCLQVGYSDEFASFRYPALPACSAVENNPYVGNPCNLAQDKPILCCDSAGTTICPAPSTKP